MIRLIFIILLFRFVNSLFTTCPQGHVGLYWVLQQLQKELITSATFYNPFYSYITFLKYVEDHDEVRDHDGRELTCVSKEGVTLKFSSVKIANEIKIDNIVDTVKKFGLSYDKVLVVNPASQRLKEICAELTVDEIEITKFHTLDDLLKSDIQKQVLEYGIKINWVRISGIVVPESIKKKRLDLAEEKSEKILAEERAKRKKIDKELEIILSIEDSKKEQLESDARMQKMISEAKAEMEKESIINQILINKAKAQAEKSRLEYENLRNLYSIPGYVDNQNMLAISSNQKIYYGEKLPSIVVGSFSTNKDNIFSS